MSDIVAALVGIAAGLVLCAAYLLVKERHGKHRQTQTGPSDPGSFTATAARVNALYSGSFTLSPGQSASVSLSPVSDINTGSRQELEVVASDMPILAHRAAKIVMRRDGLHFAAINDQFGMFDRDADATCGMPMASQLRYLYGFSSADLHKLGVSLYGHVAPAVDCQCGFYAVPADVEAQHSDSTVDLLVELSGTVIEHEHGYRASHQRVVEIRADACPYCRRAPAVAIFKEGVCTGFRCIAHTDGVSVAFCDLERVLGVPVTFEEP